MLGQLGPVHSGSAPGRSGSEINPPSHYVIQVFSTLYDDK